VDYLHLGFDTAVVISAHGLATASFDASAAHQCRLLRPFEAQVLMTAAA
jgi:hypothetical protein